MIEGAQKDQKLFTPNFPCADHVFDIWSSSMDSTNVSGEYDLKRKVKKCLVFQVN